MVDSISTDVKIKTYCDFELFINFVNISMTILYYVKSQLIQLPR